MKRVALLVLVLSLGCGRSNRRHCEYFVRDVNDLPCNPKKLDEAMCTNDLDDGSCDMGAYFACLEASVRCDGDVLVTDVTACAPMCAP